MSSVLIVGCGRIAGGSNLTGLNTHAGAYEAHREFDLVAAVDTDFSAAVAFASRYECEPYEEVSLALKVHKPDVVSVCTPDDTHFSVVSEILRSPYVPEVVFLEKPACRTPQELRSLIELSHESGTPVIVNHTRRFDNRLQVLRQCIRDGEFGEIRFVRVVYYGGWMHNGTHAVDTLSFLFDDEVEIDLLRGSLQSGHPGDPSYDIAAHFNARRSPVEFEAVDENDYQLFEFDLRFALGRIRIEDFGEVIRVQKRVRNEIGENVLEDRAVGVPEQTETAMQAAVESIHQYLGTRSIETLHETVLESIGSTVQTLWEGRVKDETDRSESS